MPVGRILVFVLCLGGVFSPFVKDHFYDQVYERTGVEEIAGCFELGSVVDLVGKEVNTEPKLYILEYRNNFTNQTQLRIQRRDTCNKTTILKVIEKWKSQNNNPTELTPAFHLKCFSSGGMVRNEMEWVYSFDDTFNTTVLEFANLLALKNETHNHFLPDICYFLFRKHSMDKEEYIMKFYILPTNVDVLGGDVVWLPLNTGIKKMFYVKGVKKNKDLVYSSNWPEDKAVLSDRSNLHFDIKHQAFQITAFHNGYPNHFNVTFSLREPYYKTLLSDFSQNYYVRYDPSQKPRRGVESHQLSDLLESSRHALDYIPPPPPTFLKTPIFTATPNGTTAIYQVIRSKEATFERLNVGFCDLNFVGLKNEPSAFDMTTFENQSNMGGQLHTVTSVDKHKYSFNHYETIEHFDSGTNFMFKERTCLVSYNNAFDTKIYHHHLRLYRNLTTLRYHEYNDGYLYRRYEKVCLKKPQPDVDLVKVSIAHNGEVIDEFSPSHHQNIPSLLTYIQIENNKKNVTIQIKYLISNVSMRCDYTSATHTQIDILTIQLNPPVQFKLNLGKKKETGVNYYERVYQESSILYSLISLVIFTEVVVLCFHLVN
uniref:6-Cys domain-containing protein n=1 Tax=Rhabditophanes sp. KR3021 TaxID=114890 RepID=A0AC35U9N0_9BILA